MTAGNRDAGTKLTLAQAGLSIDVSGLDVEHLSLRAIMDISARAT
jgi:hypothetical protein